MPRAVFLSYASQDAEAAGRICDALRPGGIEVWFDRSELRGGDAWDQNIRKQIRDCALFLPVISAATQARREGYFRREWKLAVERTHDMADGTPFLLPAVIDGTTERDAIVPDVFLKVQWTRLPDGATTAAFVERVRKLSGAGAGPDAGRSEVQPAPAAKSAPGRRRRVPSVIAGLLVILAAGWGLFLVLRPKQPERPSERGSVQVTAETAPAGLAPAAAAGLRDPQLRRAMLLIDSADCTAGDAAVAEDLCRSGLTAHPSDPDAAISLARVEAYFLLRGFDREDARFAEAKRDAERALALAPDDPDALLSMATYLFTRRIELPRATRILRQAIARRPGEPNLYRMLDDVLFVDPSVPQSEALETARRDAERFPSDALVQYDMSRHYRDAGLLQETEHYLDLAIQLGPISNAIIAKARIGLALQGDVAGMKALSDRLPEHYRGTDRVVVNQFIYACASRQYDAGLDAVRSLPEAWLADFDYTGPRELLNGELLLLKGKPELAKLSYEAALAELAQHRAVVTANFQSLWLEVWLLARLGRLEEARARNAVIFPEYERPFRLYLGTNWWFNPIPSNLLLGEKQKALELMREAVNFQYGRDIIGHALVIDPRMAPWRDDREIAAILAGTPVGKETAAAGAAVSPAVAPASTAPRDWPRDPELKRAISLLDGTEATADDFSLAEEIAKRAVDRAPTDPEAVTVMARVQGEFLRRGFDNSDARATLAKRSAERAAEIAPDDPEAIYALANYLSNRGSDLPRAERLLRRACDLDPGEPRMWRVLAETIFLQRRGEGVEAEEQNVARFPRDALTHYDLSRLYHSVGRFADMERELDATLALAPVPNAIVWKARVMFGLHGDLPVMKIWLDRVPERVRSADRAVFSNFIYACLSGQPGTGLDVMNGFPENWLTDWEYTGPTALLKASLFELQGKGELARVAYDGALAEVRRQKAASQTSDSLETANVLIAEIWALRGLGRLDEARAVDRVYLEMLPRPFRMSPLASWWFQPIPCNLLIGERETAVQLIHEGAAEPAGREAIRIRMRMDPRMAPWREDKEITGLLADPEAKK